MPDRKLFTACGLLVAFWSVAPLAQDRKATLPRTPDGHVDLQGIWDFRSATALERPARFAGREFMTADEVVAYEQEALAREDGRPPDDGRTEQSVHPVWWLDYGKTVCRQPAHVAHRRSAGREDSGVEFGRAAAKRGATGRGPNARSTSSPATTATTAFVTS